MGRSQKKKKTSSTVSSNSVSAVNNQNAQTANSDSIIRLLKSNAHTERIDACNTMAALVSPTYYSGMVSSGCVNLLVQLIHDKVPTVATAAAGAVRNICVEMGSEAISSLVNQGLINHVLITLDCVEFGLQHVDEKGNLSKDSGMHWYHANVTDMNRLLSQIFSILAAICEINLKAVTEFTTAQISNNAKHLAFIMNNTIITENMSHDKSQLVVDALYFLRSVTLDNDQLNRIILDRPDVSLHLLNLTNHTLSLVTESTTNYQTLISIMRQQLLRELNRKQGALASCFSLENIPCLPLEVSSLAASTIVHLLQSAIALKYPSTITIQLVSTALEAYNFILNNVNLDVETGHLLTALQLIKKMIEDAENGSFDAEAQTIPDITGQLLGIEGDENPVDDGQDVPDFVKDHNPMNEQELPVDNMWIDATNTCISVFNQYVNSLKYTFDGLSSLISLLPTEDSDDDIDDIYEYRLTLVSPVVQYLIEKNILQILCNYSSIRFIPQLTVVDNNHVSHVTQGYSNSPDNIIKNEIIVALSALPILCVIPLSHNINMLRIQAITVLSASTLFLPSSAIDLTVGMALYNNISGLLSNIDIDHYSQHPIVASEQLLIVNSIKTESTGDDVINIVNTLSKCTIEETSPLAASLAYLLRKPIFRDSHENAWKNIDAPNAHTLAPDSIPGCLTPSASILRLISLVSKITIDSDSVNELKMHIAAIITCLGVSPLSASNNVIFGTALLDMIASESRKTRNFNHDLAYDLVNAIFEMYSEDDRNVQSYTQIQATSRLATFVPIYNTQARELSTLYKQKKKVTKNKNDESLIDLEIKFEKTSEAADNLKNFIQYKKSKL